MSRNPNAKCDRCGRDYYRSPTRLERYSSGYCSRECYGKAKFNNPKVCEFCRLEFRAKRKEQRFCSRECAARKTRGLWGTHKKDGSFRNKNEARLHALREEFGFSSCMVVGCKYNRVYDVHRFVFGKDGGKYIIGNMFAVCPNHHAEVHRGLGRFEKISNCELRIIEENCTND